MRELRPDIIRDIIAKSKLNGRPLSLTVMGEESPSSAGQGAG